MIGWASIALVAKVVSLHETARALRSDGDFWWTCGEKERSSRCHRKAADLEREARAMESAWWSS